MFRGLLAGWLGSHLRHLSVLDLRLAYDSKELAQRFEYPGSKLLKQLLIRYQSGLCRSDAGLMFGLRRARGHRSVR